MAKQKQQGATATIDEAACAPEWTDILRQMILIRRFDVEHGFYGGYGIVGGHLTLAAGSAYALRYRGTDRVAVCYFGDGAMNIGSFHEALNMAGLWGKQGLCPIVFVIENNA